MNKSNGIHAPVLVVGGDRLAVSIANGLLANDHPAVLLTTEDNASRADIWEERKGKTLQVLTEWPDTIHSRLVVINTTDKLEDKLELIRRVERCVTNDTIIAVNIEATTLPEIVDASQQPQRIFGLNWTYPVEHTFFSEIIAHPTSDATALDRLVDHVSDYWDKDPYVLRGGFSIRARMMAAMLREALCLVEEDFASVESVDRACRNDAGYYLPFSGNFRYMDLMGTYAYGMVMKDLNPELSSSTHLSPLLEQKGDLGHVGMDQGQGFYSYTSDDRHYWEKVYKEFSVEIQELIKKYDHEQIHR